MDKITIIKKYFPNIKKLHIPQEKSIDALTDGKRVLTLMPTGEGKSLIYQVAGLMLKKTTIVISPLIALMKQHHSELEERGFSSVFMSGLTYQQQFKVLTQIAKGSMPDFIFLSPERADTDGYLEFVLNLKRDNIGLIVVDEAHCISQWGEGFRPAYKNIPIFLRRVFGPNNWPRVLCLTATLNNDDQNQVIDDFEIDEVIKSPSLWRNNLDLKLYNLGTNKDKTKEVELRAIIKKHEGDKILVFVHRKYGNKGTTRTLYESFSKEFEQCAFYDADISDKEKDRVLEGFMSGEIKIVFATSAFGMGVNISDIRVVVHYLIPESIEQYYQEVGRAGRDGKTAYGYLLLSNQSKSGRKRLIQASVSSESSIKNEYDEKSSGKKADFGSVKNEDFTDEKRIAFALLVEYGVIQVKAKGVQSYKCFKASGNAGKAFLEDIKKYSKTGLTKVICKKKGISINDLVANTWSLCAQGELKLVSSPAKALFYAIDDELSDDILNQIVNDQEEKREKRLNEFVDFVEAIERGEKAEAIVKKGLNLEVK
ncbi:RecQ family ATP-dependent DNA helicase [Isachenkonia alkalipeptolytica]|uniref:DNA 3'-5' helicase n=1 Tax=Isachenkonia alkalipeptolytica TaxID=2565777 RepID=A0AA43XK07_9CLOT|nr:RecQ family ATP-dependent DNA helicase [Isachenkonia alkalipeptolytica]NBG87681.1 ATP-dependent DNA helicase RecQ [Isachenkonia alkalipeptolytica]